VSKLFENARLIQQVRRCMDVSCTGINSGSCLELEPVEAVEFPADVDHEPPSYASLA
jgi:hypothetical protein